MNEFELTPLNPDTLLPSFNKPVDPNSETGDLFIDSQHLDERTRINDIDKNQDSELAITVEVESETELAEKKKLWQRVGHVATSVKEDWSNAHGFGRSVQVAAIVGQGLERSRMSEWLIAPAAISILKETQDPLTTGLALLGMVGATQALISHSWAEAMDTSPNTFDTINEEFPKLVELSEDIGPAQDKKWYSHIREGAAAFLSYGVTPFIISEKVSNPEMTRKEVHLSAAKLTGKCALFGFGVAYSLSEVLTRIDPVVANDIMNVADKPYTWLGLAAAFELPRFVSKRIQRFRARKESKRASKNEKEQSINNGVSYEVGEIQ